MSENDVVKRLLWSGLLAGLGAAASVGVSRIATLIWRRIYDEDPPRVSTSDTPEEEPTQIPVDAPVPDAAERVEIVAPEPQGEATSEPAYEPPAYTPSAATDDGPSGPAAVAEERPELVVAGAFAGAFILAKVLQRIGGNR